MNSMMKKVGTFLDFADGAKGQPDYYLDLCDEKVPFGWGQQSKYNICGFEAEEIQDQSEQIKDKIICFLPVFGRGLLKKRSKTKVNK
jgi:hypothetical protein